MATLLITGADGFVGRHLCAAALLQGWTVRGAVRALPANSEDAPGAAALQDVCWEACGEVGPDTNWAPLLADVDAVVHLAGRAHVLRETEADPETAYRAVNVAGTRRLAEAMLACGVRRLVFASSIGVHGSGTDDTPIHEDSPPRPHNAYTRSKWAAEQALHALSGAGLEPVIVRPALVYGPGVKGNLRRLLRWIDRGLPLPLWGVRNARSLAGVSNLADLLLHCAKEPAASNETFVAADSTALSTPELVRTLAAHMGRPARLVRAPPRMTGAVLHLLGYGLPWRQLTGSLVVDATKSRDFFHRDDPRPTDAGLAEMARWYREQARA